MLIMLALASVRYARAVRWPTGTLVHKLVPPPATLVNVVGFVKRLDPLAYAERRCLRDRCNAKRPQVRVAKRTEAGVAPIGCSAGVGRVGRPVEARHVKGDRAHGNCGLCTAGALAILRVIISVQRVSEGD